MVASLAMDAFQRAVKATEERFSPSPAGGQPKEEKPATVKAANRVTEAATGRQVPESAEATADEAVHYGLGMVLGLAYGASAEYLPEVTAGQGSVFAAATWAGLDEAAVPLAGLSPPPWKSGASTHLYSFASHLVFGLTLEATRRLMLTLLPRQSSLAASVPDPGRLAHFIETRPAVRAARHTIADIQRLRWR